jgi:pimeloyl-ACP methyl ester carboxylesterase
MPDQHGYGDTEKPAAGYDKRTMAADLRALGAHLGIERIASSGGTRAGRVVALLVGTEDARSWVSGVFALLVSGVYAAFHRPDLGAGCRTRPPLFLADQRRPACAYVPCRPSDTASPRCSCRSGARGVWLSGH